MIYFVIICFMFLGFIIGHAYAEIKTEKQIKELEHNVKFWREIADKRPPLKYIKKDK